MLRIGYGTDLHRLVDNRPFFIGGIFIPHHKGALGHSDADVLLHAICDAIIGALALGDIGSHFPDSDKQYKSISSENLLTHVVELMKNEGYSIVNLDSVVNLQLPKLSPFIPDIRKKIATILECPITIVSVKAKTGEGFAPVGTQEAVSAEAVVILQKS